MPQPLLSVSEALHRVLADLKPLPADSVSLTESLGRVLAEDVTAGFDLPPFPNSAMDGYAVRAVDVVAASAEQPVVLRVLGEAGTGQAVSAKVALGGAVRVMTGAPMPEGADAVVPVEDTTDPSAMAGRPLPSQIGVCAPARSGAYVRRAGQDVQAGSLVLRAGQRLRPQDVGMLAALGVTRPRVSRKARLAILSTGDELVEPDQPLAPGQIRDANGYSLMAAVQAAGAEAIRLGIVRDQAQAVADGLDRAVAAGADLILASAGVSMGAYDFVRPVVQERGKLEFWKVNMRPGKPLALGTYREVPFLGLPGNPVSAMVTFEVFVRPAIRRLHGQTGEARLRFVARLDQAIESDGRETYLRAVVQWGEGWYHARPTRSQDSNILSSLVEANALLRLPAGVRFAREGETLEGWFLEPLRAD